MKKNSILYAVAAGVAGAALLGALWWFGALPSQRQLYLKIKDQPTLVSLFAKVQAQEQQLKKTPDDAALYMDLALNWKSLGHRSNGVTGFFRKSLAVYEKGIAKFGSKNILFYLNAGKVAEELRDYAKAEEYFKAAIEISPADENGYLSLADLYSYKMGKSVSEVAAVYNQGGPKMADPTALIWGRGSYLKRVGQYAAALPDYEVLSKAFPDNQGYKDAIAEIKAKLNQQ